MIHFNYKIKVVGTISTFTAQKRKFFIKDFFSKYDQICSFLRISSHLLKRSFPANISTLDQHCFNVVDQRWNNVDLTLKMKQNSTSDFQRCTTLIQRRCATLKQRWYNFISTLFQLSLNNSKSCIKTSRSSDKYWFAKSISKFYSADYFEQYINNSTTYKPVNSYSNFLTVHIGYKGENGETQKSSKL